jgi:hypothetical protein
MPHDQLGGRVNTLGDQHPCRSAEGRRAAFHDDAAVDFAIEQLAAGAVVFRPSALSDGDTVKTMAASKRWPAISIDLLKT